MVYDQNELFTSENPYLLQHKHHPVAWKSWSRKAFEEAISRNVPVLISIGYSSCHWCHVMAHEVFEQQEVANLMNENLVCIKVDREEHPEVDEYYMEACQKLNGSGGWPLNIFADTSGKPFFAATYVPINQWISLLERLKDAWKFNQPEILTFAQELTLSFSEESTDNNQASIAEIKNQLWSYLDSHFDDIHPDFSGKGQSPRFPLHALYAHLLMQLTLPSDLAKHLESVLETIQDSGLHDLVGGGFHRYSTDRAWRVPHFEKMLYDNAQFLFTFSLASGRFNRPDFLLTAKRTADYLIRDMAVYDKTKFLGFASAEDADDPLGEGRFYAWTTDDLKLLLGEKDGNQLASWWDLRNDPTNIHGVLPFQIPHPRGSEVFQSLSLQDKNTIRSQWILQCDLLQKKRSLRPRPFKDTKIITSWNALTLAGLSVLFAQSGDKKYEDAAKLLANMLITRIKDSFLERLPGKNGHITDYGHLAFALFTAWEIFQEETFLINAEKLIQLAIPLFADEKGKIFSSDPTSRMFSGYEEKNDHVYPAGIHHLLLTWVRLTAHERLPDLKPMMEKIMQERWHLLSDYPVLNPTLLTLLDEWQNGPDTIHFPEKVSNNYSPLILWAGTNVRPMIDRISEKYQFCKKYHCAIALSSVKEFEKSFPFSWKIGKF